MMIFATADAIIDTVATEFRIPRRRLIHGGRAASLVRCRFIAMWLVRALTAASYPEIGRAFGGKDHSTVMHAVRTVETLRAANPRLAEMIDELGRRSTPVREREAA